MDSNVGRGKRREREKKSQPTIALGASLSPKGIEWSAILSQSRFCKTSHRMNILWKIYPCLFHRASNEFDKLEMNSRATTSAVASRPPFRWAKVDGVDANGWTANFVRYTVEIFSLDFSWKARVNEFGKGLVNIRWLLNLCTRVNKYCACGTQEIREPEIVPAIYTYVYISDLIYLSIFLNFFFLLISYFWKGTGLNCHRFEVGAYTVLSARVSSMHYFILNPVVINWEFYEISVKNEIVLLEEIIFYDEPRWNFSEIILLRNSFLLLIIQLL